MATFTNILVNLDAVDTEHPALDQAAELAARMRARLTIVDVLPNVPDRARQFVTDQIEQELVDHRRDLLKTIAARRGSDIATTVLRGEAPAISLIREVQRGAYDLLVRSHGVGQTDPTRFGPIDMQLLRKCPCPVWLVGPSARPQPRRIPRRVRHGQHRGTDSVATARIRRGDQAGRIRLARHGRRQMSASPVT